MPHYYDKEQDAPLQPFRVAIAARDRSLQLWSGNGVFSKGALDVGTRLLIDECVLQPEWHVHDLGCGIGVVGIVAKLSEPSCTVLCSDVSGRAITLAHRNVQELGLNIEVRQSDGYEGISELFDTVLVNPPYVAGRSVVFRLLEEAALHLRPGGLLQAVARHQKGGAMIGAKLKELLGNCDDSRRQGGFRVYVAQKSP